MYAIIQDGGHQYRVEKGQKLSVQLRPGEVGQTFHFDQVCLVGGGGSPKIGAPFVSGAKVEAKVLKNNVGGIKLYPSSYRTRKHTKRRIGHRQHFTEIEITGISG